MKRPPPLLVVFGGLPGTGKTSLCKELASLLGAVYLRVDTIEHVLKKRDCLKIGDEGYLVSYAIAEENLKTGNTVIADSVNPIDLTRIEWQGVAKRASVKLLEIEIICSDLVEHRRRVESRKADIEGFELPSWKDVIEREYHQWSTKNITIDTAKVGIKEAVEILMKAIG